MLAATIALACAGTELFAGLSLFMLIVVLPVNIEVPGSVYISWMVWHELTLVGPTASSLWLGL